MTVNLWRFLGLACVPFGCAGLSLGVYLAYLQWWVHPEMTRPQFFWAYWPLFVVDMMLWGIALLCLEAAIRGKR